VNMLEAALSYLNKHRWSVIPIGRDKRPLVSWEPYQKQRPSEAQVREWWTRWPQANIGVVTGAVSGIVVLDQDSDEARPFLRDKHLPPTPCAYTGKGTHWYFKHPGYPVRNFARRLPGLDFRGDGGYVLAPPSLHPSGRRYRWADTLSPDDVEPAPCPAWLFAVLKRERQEQGPADDTWVKELLQGVRQGFRHDSATRLAGYLLCRNVSEAVALELLRAWNEMRNSPPLEDDELARIVRDIARAESTKQSEETPWVRWYAIWTDPPQGTGIWRATKCPMCAGDMRVNIKTGRWTCAACGTGDALALVQKCKRCTYQRAKQILKSTWNEVAGDGLSVRPDTA